MLDVTVCIMSYNRSAYLREAVRSVLAQTRRPKSIVIYDNASDKRVFESIEEFLGDELQWVGAEVNHPFIWNFNRAMTNSESKYVMMLHDDDRLCPNFLEAQIGLLESDASLVAVSCNGYFIDEAGKKNGETLVPVVGNTPVELYRCSGQVAFKYASNSCIPLSPTIYRRQIASSVKFREEFGKVCDAVYFCDLAEIGTIAYQTRPLYESRLHTGQDSSYFPYDLMNQLEQFFLSRKCITDEENAKMQSLLLKQHTTRNLKQAFHSVKNGNFLRAVSLFTDDKFRFTDAAKIVAVWIYKYIFRK